METNNKEDRMGKYTAKRWGQYLDEAGERTSKIDTDFLAPTNYDNYKEDFLDYMRAYEKDHSAELDRYYSFYREAIMPEFFSTHYILLNEKRIKRVLSRCKVMVLNCTQQNGHP